MIPVTTLKQIKYLEVKCKDIKPLVVILCLTYNHEPYLRDALEGFVMQKTDFPFVAIVHEDASTDKTSDILKEYAEKYSDIIFPIFEKENQYSQGDTLTKIMNLAITVTGAHYVALCEGDDYWIDPLKLQKQVDFLENNKEYSLCATNVLFEYPNGEKKIPSYNVTKEKDSKIEEIILKGGSFISTPSIICKAKDFINLPYTEYKLYVGDYPLQIYLSFIGKVRILKDITCIYRYMAIGSWNARMLNSEKNSCLVKEHIEKEEYLLKTMDFITDFKYHLSFEKRACFFSFYLWKNYSKIMAFLYILKNPKKTFNYLGFKFILFQFSPKFIQRLYKR